MSQQPSQPHCVLAYATGRVQGVGYRAFIEREALIEQLSGHARNLPDGRVEMLLCGSFEAVETVLDRARIGPPLAEVIGLEVAEAACPATKGFSTG